MKHKTLYTLLALVVLASMILAACAPTAPATTEAPPAPVVTEAPTEVPVATEAPTEVPVATEEPTEAPPAYEGMMYEAPDCNYGGIIKSIEAVDEFQNLFQCSVSGVAPPSELGDLSRQLADSLCGGFVLNSTDDSDNHLHHKILLSEILNLLVQKQNRHD